MIDPEPLPRLDRSLLRLASLMAGGGDGSTVFFFTTPHAKRNETMTTTIDMAEKRIEAAKTTQSDLMGKRQGGIELQAVGDYVIVCDGTDRWLILMDDYVHGVDAIVDDVLAGKHDYSMVNDEPEMLFDAYTELCQSTDCIYSCIGSPSNPMDVLAIADVTADQLDEIVDALGIADEINSEEC